MLTAGVLRVSFAIIVTPFGSSVRTGARPACSSGMLLTPRRRFEPANRAIRLDEHFARGRVDLLERRHANLLGQTREELHPADRREVAELMGDVRHTVVVEHEA